MSFVYKRSGRILAATAALLAAAVFLLIISILQARRPSLTLRQNGFLGANAEAVYTRAGNGLAVADRDHIALYAVSGKCAAQAQTRFREPKCAGSPLLAVFYDALSPGIETLYPDGTHKSADPEGPVLFADANETGLIAVIWKNDAGRGTVMVYDTDLTPLFRWDAGSSVPLSARTGGEDLLCVSSQTGDGSRLHFFRIDRAEEYLRVSFPGEKLLDFDYLDDGMLAVVTEQRLLLLDSAGEAAASVSFGSQRPMVCSAGGSHADVYAASAEGGTVTVLGSDRESPMSLACPAGVKDLSGCGDELLVLYDNGESALYSRDLSEIVWYQPDRDADRVFLTPNGMAFFTGPAGVTLADFGR